MNPPDAISIERVLVTGMNSGAVASGARRECA